MIIIGVMRSESRGSTLLSIHIALFWSTFTDDDDIVTLAYVVVCRNNSNNLRAGIDRFDSIDSAFNKTPSQIGQRFSSRWQSRSVAIVPVRFRWKKSFLNNLYSIYLSMRCVCVVSVRYLCDSPQTCRVDINTTSLTWSNVRKLQFITV